MGGGREHQKLTSISHKTYFEPDMQIDYLSLKNFRNYARLELGIPTGPVVLHGENAQGKTSLLEAIYYLATSTSPYTNSDRQLINWQVANDILPYAQVGADIITTERIMSRVEITLIMESEGTNRFRKELRINGVSKRRSDLLGMIGVVMFLPQDLMLVEGSPSQRRRYLDLTLGQVDDEYTEALNKFDKVLLQRNALLRRIAANYASKTELEYWDEQLAECAGVIIAARQRIIRELEGLAQDYHHDISGGREDLQLVYQPSFEPTVEGDGQQSFNLFGMDLHREMDAAEIAPQYREALLDNQKEEVERGMTLIGPQRDDLRFMVNGRDLSMFGSRGQARTGVLAIKLAELVWMKEQFGAYPILLLDEVVAELDARRRAYLLEQIKHVNQVLLTTTELSVLTNGFLSTATLWQVEEGQISPINSVDA
ncbi:MAG: DNA replication/repair protein RecF [Chloroflexi bacterium]|nr:DNA replication/repair protein RecF [Chloroflexota bacterium]